MEIFKRSLFRGQNSNKNTLEFFFYLVSMCKFMVFSYHFWRFWAIPERGLPLGYYIYNEQWQN